MITMRIAVLTAPVVVALLLAPGRAQAGYVALPTTLDQLTPMGNYTTVGDKTFTFLSYSSTTVATNSIGVTALSQSAGGIITPYGFQLSGSFSASGVNASSDIAVNFTVMSSGAPITAINLFSNGSTTGSGFTDVSESVFTLTGNGGEGTYLGQISVVGSGTASLSLGAGYSGLYVTKNITETTGASGGSGTISIVQQTFPQGVPEPASIVMMGLGLGLAGLFACRRALRKTMVA